MTFHPNLSRPQQKRPAEERNSIMSFPQSPHPIIPYQPEAENELHFDDISQNSQQTVILNQDQEKQNSYFNQSERTIDQQGEYPLLFLDVTLGTGQQTRITLFEGEDHQSTVETFCKENCLSDKKKCKLMNVIHEQLTSMLPRKSSEVC